jgi:hypothetical protein
LRGECVAPGFHVSAVVFRSREKAQWVALLELVTTTVIGLEVDTITDGILIAAMLALINRKTFGSCGIAFNRDTSIASEHVKVDILTIGLIQRFHVTVRTAHPVLTTMEVGHLPESACIVVADREAVTCVVEIAQLLTLKSLPNIRHLRWACTILEHTIPLSKVAVASEVPGCCCSREHWEKEG